VIWNNRFYISGELRREDGQQPETVAVKVLKETATREAEEDFMREVDIMSAFRHSNILSLIGVVLRGMVMSRGLLNTHTHTHTHTHTGHFCNIYVHGTGYYQNF